MNITDFIPQRAPFIMVDEILFSDGVEFKTSFEIQADNIFVNADKTLSESAVIENIAQTCAAGMGYHIIQNNLPHNGLGFIGSISKLTVESEAKVGEIIHTTVKILHVLDSIRMIEGVAMVGDRQLLKCQMKIVA